MVSRLVGPMRVMIEHFQGMTMFFLNSELLHILNPGAKGPNHVVLCGSFPCVRLGSISLSLWVSHLSLRINKFSVMLSYF